MTNADREIRAITTIDKPTEVGVGISPTTPTSAAKAFARVITRRFTNSDLRLVAKTVFSDLRLVAKNF
jgi:hypothetical protein